MDDFSTVALPTVEQRHRESWNPKAVLLPRSHVVNKRRIRKLQFFSNFFSFSASSFSGVHPSLRSQMKYSTYFQIVKIKTNLRKSSVII